MSSIKFNTTLAGKSVLVNRYISDGPGYCGPLLIHVGGRAIQVVEPAIQDPNGNFTVRNWDMDSTLPEIVGVLPMDEAVHSRLVFDALNENSLNCCGGPDEVQTDHCVIVQWSDGSQGAILVWGDPCFVSAIFFSGEHQGETFVSLEDATDGTFVEPSNVADSMIVPESQRQDVLDSLRGAVEWISDPAKNVFMRVSDYRSQGPRPIGG